MSCKSCGTPLYTSRSDLCIACAGALQLVEEFKDQWDSVAVRNIAADICLSAVRQVRALRTYQRGLRSAREREEQREAERRAEASGGGAKDRGGSPLRRNRKEDGKREKSPSRARPREDDRGDEDEEYTEEEESGEAESPRVVDNRGREPEEAWKLTASAKALPRKDRGRSSSHRESGKSHRFQEDKERTRGRGSRDRSRSPKRGEEPLERSRTKREEKDSTRQDLLPQGLLKIHSHQEKEKWQPRRKRTRRRR